MKTEFHIDDGGIIVVAEAFGPRGWTRARLLVDTGATVTTLAAELMLWLGYDLSQPLHQSRVATVAGESVVDFFVVDQLSCLGIDRRQLLVVVQPFPTVVPALGLLGLDFFADRQLTIDFKQATIELI